jgi:hypothetical protein
MPHYVFCNRFLVVGAALLFVTPSEVPSTWLPQSNQQGDKAEIRWEFDTGG